MSTSTSAKKLQRLVLAQTVTESIAKSQVGLLSSELAGMEQKLTMTRDSFAKSKTSLLFADLHLKHIHNLVEGCNDLRSRLENARQELQSEKDGTGEIIKYEDKVGFTFVRFNITFL